MPTRILRDLMTASLSIRQVTVTRGPNTVLADIDLLLAPGQRVGLVGPNGVGKSTLLAVAAGQLAPDSGSVACAPPTALVGWLHQEPERSSRRCVLPCAVAPGWLLPMRNSKRQLPASQPTTQLDTWE